MTKYPFKSDAIKSAKVLAECSTELLFGQCKKYRVYLRGYGNMEREKRYTIFSPNLDRVISYMQERCNAFCKRHNPERVEVHIFHEKIDFEHPVTNPSVYNWGYTPTYR